MTFALRQAGLDEDDVDTVADRVRELADGNYHRLQEDDDAGGPAKQISRLLEAGVISFDDRSAVDRKVIGKYNAEMLMRRMLGDRAAPPRRRNPRHPAPDAARLADAAIRSLTANADDPRAWDLVSQLELQTFLWYSLDEVDDRRPVSTTRWRGHSGTSSGLRASPASPRSAAPSTPTSSSTSGTPIPRAPARRTTASSISPGCTRRTPAPRLGFPHGHDRGSRLLDRE